MNLADKVAEEHLNNLISYIGNISSSIIGANKETITSLFSLEQNKITLENFLFDESSKIISISKKDDEKENSNKYKIETVPSFKNYKESSVIFIKKVPRLDCINNSLIKRDIQILNFSGGNDMSMYNYMINCINSEYNAPFYSYQGPVNQKIKNLSSKIDIDKNINLNINDINILMDNIQNNRVNLELKIEDYPIIKQKVDEYFKKTGKYPKVEDISPFLDDKLKKTISEIINLYKTNINEAKNEENNKRKNYSLDKIYFNKKYYSYQDQIKRAIVNSELIDGMSKINKNLFNLKKSKEKKNFKEYFKKIYNANSKEANKIKNIFLKKKTFGILENKSKKLDNIFLNEQIIEKWNKENVIIYNEKININEKTKEYKNKLIIEKYKEQLKKIKNKYEEEIDKLKKIIKNYEKQNLNDTKINQILNYNESITNQNNKFQSKENKEYNYQDKYNSKLIRIKENNIEKIDCITIKGKEIDLIKGFNSPKIKESLIIQKMDLFSISKDTYFIPQRKLNQYLIQKKDEIKLVSLEKEKYHKVNIEEFHIREFKPPENVCQEVVSLFIEKENLENNLDNKIQYIDHIEDIYIPNQLKEPLSIEYLDYLSILGDKNFHSINKNIMEYEIQNVDNMIIYALGEKVDNIIEYIDSIELIYSFQKDLQLYKCDQLIIPRKKREQNQIQYCDRLIILKREKQKYKKQKAIYFCLQGEKKEQNQSEFYYIKELYKIKKSKNEKVLMNKIENTKKFS